MRAAFEAPGSPRWAEVLLDIRHDVYHLPEYVGFATRQEEAGRPLAFIAQEGDRHFFLPVIERSIPDALTLGRPRSDVTSSRGYPGPIVSTTDDGDDTGFLDRAIDAFSEACRERDIVTAYVRLHPLLSPPPDAFGRAGTVVEHGHSVSIDLSLSAEELLQQTRQDHRYGIRKAGRMGYSARLDEDWACFDAFLGIYEESMRRLQADPFWWLSRAYFEDLRDSLGDRLRLCVAVVDGEVAAAALLTEVDGIVEYHLGGTADAHIRASPSKLTVDFARQWAKARGNRWLHLGGSPGKDDSLMAYKAGFSPLQHPVASWRLVADAEAYRVLTLAWASQHEAVPDPPEAYFPAYRR